MFSAYLVGNPGDERFKILAERLMQLKMKKGASPDLDIIQETYVPAVLKAREGAYILRAMAKSRLDLQPLCDAILAPPSAEGFLG